MDELKERYSKLINEELLNIVYVKSSDYTEESIKLAKSILEERGITQLTDTILQQVQNYQNEKKNLETIEKEKEKKASFYWISIILFLTFIGAIYFYESRANTSSSNSYYGNEESAVNLWKSKGYSINPYAGDDWPIGFTKEIGVGGKTIWSNNKTWSEIEVYKTGDGLYHIRTKCLDGLSGRIKSTYYTVDLKNNAVE